MFAKVGGRSFIAVCEDEDDLVAVISELMRVRFHVKPTFHQESAGLIGPPIEGFWVFDMTGGWACWCLRSMQELGQHPEGDWGVWVDRLVCHDVVCCSGK